MEKENSNGLSTVGRIVRTIAGAIFPTDIYCICCGSIIDSTRTYSMCDSCIRKFRWIGENACKKCGKPMSKNDSHELCYDCRTITRYFDKGYTCCLYDIYARAVMMDLKYRDKSYLGRIVGDIMADRMEGKCDHDLVVPVPISPQRMEKRGYNQAALIAARFSERTGIPMDDNVLVREDRKMAMKDLDAMQRRLNVRGVFSLTEHGKAVLHGLSEKNHPKGVDSAVQDNTKSNKPVKALIVDDIMTTASTVDECARVLKEAGAAGVDVLTFAAGASRIQGQRMAESVSRGRTF